MLRLLYAYRIGKEIIFNITVFSGLIVILLLIWGGCVSQGRVTEGTVPRAYPYSTTVLQPVDIQLFRDGNKIQMVNHTVHSYNDFSLWINERYIRQIPKLPAGSSHTFSLFEFVDEYSEPFRAGGMLATRKPEPIVKAEIETSDGLVGLIVIPEK